MCTWLLLIFAIVGCRAGVLHHEYTTHLEHVPVITKQVYQQIALETPLLYGIPIESSNSHNVVQAPKKKQSQRQQQQRKPQRSFSYQFRTQHLAEEQVADVPTPVLRNNNPQEFQQIEIQQFQPTQQYINLNLQEVPQISRRLQKTPKARVQAQPKSQAKPKQIDVASIENPEYSHIDYATYVTPVIYYISAIENQHEQYHKEQKLQQPQYEQKEQEVESAEENEEEEEEEGSLDESVEPQEENESEVVVANVQLQQRLFASPFSIRRASEYKAQDYNDPIKAYKAFNSAQNDFTPLW